MFEKLRRAKSFIHKSKREEERQKYAEVDFCETSHLRRNVVIDSETIKQQNNLNKIGDRRKTTLKRQVSKSNEHLHDQVVEQLRRINFGDSYSKKHAQKLKESSEEVPVAFDRRHPAFISERNFRRRSFGVEERAKNAQKSGRNEKHVQHRTSGDVLSNFDRKNPAYRSEGKFGVGKSAKSIPHEVVSKSDLKNTKQHSESQIGTENGVKNTQGSEKNENILRCKTDGDVLKHSEQKNPPKTRYEEKNAQEIIRNGNNLNSKTAEDVVSDFERRNLGCLSEMSIQLLRQKCSEQTENSTSWLTSSEDDFLLNRKSIDLSYNFDRRSPAYVSDRGARKVKPDVLERSGLKNLFQKVKGSPKSQDRDWSETSSFSSGSASASSSASTSIERNHPAYCPEQNTRNEEASRKRHYNLTKPNFDRNKPAYSSERTLAEECRKKVIDKLKRDGDKSGDR